MAKKGAGPEAFQRAPLSGLLWQWMYEQERNFAEFTDRLLELETWEVRASERASERCNT
jgi:hypothetical protein